MNLTQGRPKQQSYTNISPCPTQQNILENDNSVIVRTTQGNTNVSSVNTKLPVLPTTQSIPQLSNYQLITAIQHNKPKHTCNNLSASCSTQHNNAVESMSHHMVIDILSLNVCGIKSKVSSVDFINNIKRYDVFCLSETKCDDVDSINLKAFMEDIGYDVIFKNRCVLSRYKSGGILIGIKKGINFKWDSIVNDCECLLSIIIDGRSVCLEKDLVISSVYIPPSHSMYGRGHHFDELDNFLLTYNSQDYEYILCGDFNAHTLTLSDVTNVNLDGNDHVTDDDVPLSRPCDYNITENRANQDLTPDRNSYGKKMVEICRNNQVYIFNGRLGEDCNKGQFTTTFNTTLDYFLGTPFVMHLVKNFRVLDYDALLSDVHCGLHAQLKFCITRNIITVPTNTHKVKQSCIKPGKWNSDKSIEYEGNIDKDKVNNLVSGIHNMTVDEIHKELQQILIKPALGTFPQYKKKIYTKKSNNVTLEGYDYQCLKERKQYHKARQKYNQHKNKVNFDKMIIESKKYKIELKRVKTKERSNIVEELRKIKCNDPKTYWKILNGQKKNPEIPISLNQFYEHFKQLATDNNLVNSNTDLENTETDHSYILNDPITEQEVLKSIKKLKNNKAPGTDMIINEYIKTTKNILLPFYVMFFNKILDNGVMPSEWLVGMIVPIYKGKGDTSDVNNYRGITLLSCLGKLFTSILNERLTKYSNTMNIINETQAGFRHDYSTLDHIFLLKCVIDLFKWRKKKLFCLFIDYKKAFDLVCRDGLWFKLVKEKVNGKILNVIRNMYDNIRSCVMLNQEISENFVCNMGVRQGENLSPLLFAFYVNDIESKLLEHNCNFLDFGHDLINSYLKLLVLMYADDTIVLCDSEGGMRQALMALNTYCNEWKLKLNCNKSKIVIFSRGKVDLSKYEFKFECEKIEVVEDYKYLGLTFNYNGRFRKGELELKEQATRAMYSLVGKCRKFDLPVDMQIELFNTMVQPVLTYGSEVWGHYIIREIELLHLKFLKHMLFVHKNTSNVMVYGELGVYPLDIHIKCKMLCFWSRLTTGKQSKLSYVMYQCMLHLDRLGLFTSPWIASIKQLLNECGMSGFWLTQNVPNTEWFKKAVERKLMDQWITVWYNNLSTNAICRNYNIFKGVYELETYLTKLPKNSRILLTRFRICNNRLPVNVGRYTGVSREERVCNLCNDNTIADEFHVLLKCSNEDLVRWRDMYVPSYYTNRPTIFKFTELLQNTNINVLTNLSKFSKLIMIKFR